MRHFSLLAVILLSLSMLNSKVALADTATPGLPSAQSEPSGAAMCIVGGVFGGLAGWGLSQVVLATVLGPPSTFALGATVVVGSIQGCRLLQASD